MPDVRWFDGATLNYARNALRTAWTDPSRTAIIFDSERGRAGSLTYAELAAQVARVARGLRSLGVGRGDRVAALLPNVPEAVIGLLATASLGAIWSSCSPDFGARSVIDRFAQIEPKVLIACDGYGYNGKEYSRAQMLDDVLTALPGPPAVVMVNLLGEPGAPGPRRAAWDDFGAAEGDHHEPEFEEVPFAHPLWVVLLLGHHRAAQADHARARRRRPRAPQGALVPPGPASRRRLHLVHHDRLDDVELPGRRPAGRGHDRALRRQRQLPRTDRLWQLTAEHGVTYLGVGAPYLVACMKAGLRPGEEHDLSALRAIGSTGSPLPPEAFDWVYQAVKPDLLLGSFSGGTDICTGFVGPCPLLPVRSGIISGRCLGAAVEAYDEDGKPVTGQVGELVLTQPMPSMPVGFWNDPGGVRYRESYFDMYPGVWRHGDWIEMLPDGGCVIYGRSDATLNRGGVRMGTSEFYRAVEAFEEVADSLVVDTGRLGAEGRLILFVVPAAGAGARRRPEGQAPRGAAGPAVAAPRARRDPPGARHTPDPVR